MNNPDIDRLNAPAMQTLHFDGFPSYECEQINNHFPCYIIENDHSQVVRLDMCIPSGSWTQQKPLQSSSLARMLTEGTTRYSSFEIAEAIDFSGAYLDAASSHHQTIISVYAVKDILVSLFPLLKSILTEPTFPGNELETIMANNKQEFIIGNNKVMGVARRIFPSMLYGENHPYGRVLQEQDFDHVSPGDLTALYNTLPWPEMKIYLGGNIDDQVLGLWSDFMSDPAFTRKTPVDAPGFTPAPSKEKEKVVPVPGAVQSAIMMGLPVVGRQHPDFPLLMLTNTLLGGYFGSRLMKTIREEKGFTYGISSGITARPNGSHLSIQTEVKSEITQQAIDEIFKEISRLSTAMVSTEELNTARNYLFGNFLRGMDGPFALLDRLETAHQDGLQPEIYYRNYWDSVAAASPADVQAMMKKHLSPDLFKVLVVGKK